MFVDIRHNKITEYLSIVISFSGVLLFFIYIFLLSFQRVFFIASCLPVLLGSDQLMENVSENVFFFVFCLCFVSVPLWRDAEMDNRYPMSYAMGI
jgi:succinate dehydrogenase/fumarate reductase cytochrome b subunit